MKDTILFVDDDANILAAYKRNLRKQFNIHTANSGQEGLTLIEEKGPFGVVLSDLRMPGMDGFDFLSAVKNVCPDSVCIMLTGHAELQSSLRAVNEGYIFRFLTKPCKINILSKAICSGLEQYERNIDRRKGDEKSAASVKTQKIMIVDDDPEILSMLSNTIKSHRDIDVITADSGKVALKMLSLIKIDLVIADMEMDEMDGLKFMETVNRSDSTIPMLLMTWNKDDTLLNQAKIRGGYRCLEKPFHPDDFLETLMEELYSGPKGVIDGISIPAFLQMIEMEEKTCTLVIKSGHETGIMYFLKGSLLDAETDDVTGQEAAFRIINWVKAAIEIENTCRKKDKAIRLSLMQILMEAAKMKDDSFAGYA